MLVRPAMRATRQATRGTIPALSAGRATVRRSIPNAGLKIVPARRSFCSTPCGPDSTRGFDVKEYDGLWRALTQDSTWPSDRSIAVVGPVGDNFFEIVEAKCAEADGCTVLSLTTQPKTRWQSIRVMLRCGSADDFCALHSTLKGLEFTKAIV